jgi:hypothetical protein
MFPHIRQIHRFVVDGQLKHVEREGVEDGLVKGTGRDERVWFAAVGWEERRV